MSHVDTLLSGSIKKAGETKKKPGPPDTHIQFGLYLYDDIFTVSACKDKEDFWNLQAFWRKTSKIVQLSFYRRGEGLSVGWVSGWMRLVVAEGLTKACPCDLSVGRLITRGKKHVKIETKRRRELLIRSIRSVINSNRIE